MCSRVRLEEPVDKTARVQRNIVIQIARILQTKRFPKSLLFTDRPVFAPKHHDGCRNERVECIVCPQYAAATRIN
jgi:hypothetical protein